MQLSLKQIKKLENIDVYDIDALEQFLNQNQLISLFVKDIDSFDELTMDQLQEIQDNLYYQQQKFFITKIKCGLDLNVFNNFFAIQKEYSDKGESLTNDKFLELLEPLISIAGQPLSAFKKAEGTYNINIQQFHAITEVINKTIQRLFGKKP